jgi:hypothetical protein
MYELCPPTRPPRLIKRARNNTDTRVTLSLFARFADFQVSSMHLNSGGLAEVPISALKLLPAPLQPLVLLFGQPLKTPLIHFGACGEAQAKSDW